MEENKILGFLMFIVGFSLWFGAVLHLSIKFMYFMGAFGGGILFGLGTRFYFKRNIIWGTQ